MVKDVCADCNNNRISYIDSYAKEFIGKYFLVKYKKDDTLSVEYDYAMIQKMCLKFAFNDLRARKKDVSFFDDEVKEFLFANLPFERGEILFSKGFFDFSDIRKLQDKAKTSYTLSTRRPRFDYE